MAASELRKTILEADDEQSALIDVPEWGVTVLIKGMSAKERALLLKRVSKGGEVDLGLWFTELTIRSTHDPETGEKVFDPADRDVLANKSGAAVSRIAEEASRLSGLGDRDLEVRKGNSETQSDVSS